MIHASKIRAEVLLSACAMLTGFDETVLTVCDWRDLLRYWFFDSFGHNAEEFLTALATAIYRQSDDLKRDKLARILAATSGQPRA